MTNMSQKDFERLCESIKDSFSNLTRTIESGISSAGDAFNQAIGHSKEKQPTSDQARQPSAPYMRGVGPAYPPGSNPSRIMQGRFRSSAGLTLSGIIFTALGGIGTLIFGISLLVNLLASPAVHLAVFIASMGILGVATGISLWALIVGIKRLRLASALKAFRRIIGNREVCTISELALRTQIPESRALALARKMIRLGLVPQGRLDDECTSLCVTDESYRLYLQAKQAQHQRELEQRSRRAEAEAQRSQASATSTKVDGKTAAFISQGEGYLAQLRALDIAIDDKALSEKIVTIEGLVERIIDRVKDTPALVEDLRRLMDYYLPTTTKLLAAYDQLEEQPIQGENISASRREIEQTLDTLVTAYEKLLDSTFKDMSMDVSSDVAVLNAILAQEGLTDSPFSTKERPRENS